MRDKLIHLPRQYKRLMLIANDLLLIECCLLIAFYFRLGWWPGEMRIGWSLSEILNHYLPVFLVSPTCLLAFFYGLGLYSTVTRHTGVEVFNVIARGVSFGALLVLLVFFLLPLDYPLPRSVLLLFWALAVVAILSSRLIAGRWLHGTSLYGMVVAFTGFSYRRKNRGRPVAIYGAGAAGRQLANVLRQGKRFYPIAFIDDNRAMQGEVVAGIKVYSPDALRELVAGRSGFEVFLALPSVGRHRREAIIRFLEPLDVHVRSVPSLGELAEGLVTVEDIREVEVADILGRDAVPPDRELLEQTISGRTLLVTGAGGSIGGELCRQILRQGPSTIVLLDHSEFSLYTISSELEELAESRERPVKVVAILGSVTDGGLLAEIFSRHRVDTVYHAAAYKHVPLVEGNGYRGFINNVIGTVILARAVIAARVREMVLVSTDKAVRPTNYMGATKRLAELVLQALSRETIVEFSSLTGFGVGNGQVLTNVTRFTMVRFGNVLDSSGSVIPKFRAQIRKGGPVTVTHRNVTRYFMTIPEAAELVLQANGLSEGGDVFILDMGKPVKIEDLARRLIHLSGLSLRDETNPEGDIEIFYTGIRPGEKLFEELLIDDSASPTRHPKIWRASERVIPWEELQLLLRELGLVFRQGSQEGIGALLSRPEIDYRPADSGDSHPRHPGNASAG